MDHANNECLTPRGDEALRPRIADHHNRVYRTGRRCKKELPYNNFMIFSICWLGVSPQKDLEMVLRLRTTLTLEHPARDRARFARGLKGRAFGLIRIGTFSKLREASITKPLYGTGNRLTLAVQTSSFVSADGDRMYGACSSKEWGEDEFNCTLGSSFFSF